jgi:hypothetical protein
MESQGLDWSGVECLGRLWNGSVKQGKVRGILGNGMVRLGVARRGLAGEVGHGFA